MNQKSRHLIHILLWHGVKIKARKFVLLAEPDLIPIFILLVCVTFKHFHSNWSCLPSFSSSLGLKSPGSVDRISWKSTGFSHCEFAAAPTTEACHLLTEMSIDFPTTPKINGRNCANGPEIDATSDLGRLLQAEPPLNSSHGLARNSMKTFSKKGKKLVSYRRSRGQGKWINCHLGLLFIHCHTE